MKLSLTCIAGNCARDIVRFLEAFQPHFDEVVIVRAIGSAAPDATLDIARERGCVVGEYRNAPEREDWPHVDDFAAARNVALNLATGDWISWADLDDDCRGYENARAMLAKLPDDIWILQAPYIVPEQGTSANFRERFWRAGKGLRWMNPIHENLVSLEPRPGPDGKTDRLSVIHAPRQDRENSNPRNLRILESIPPEERSYAHDWYLFTELGRTPSRRHECIEVAKRVLGHPDSRPPERYECFLQMASLSEDAATTAQLLTQAWSEAPGRAEALYELANLEILCGNFARALDVGRALMACVPPAAPEWNHRAPFYGYLREDLWEQINRLNGRAKHADALHFNRLQASPVPVISLLHATKGRIEQATTTRAKWLSLANHPESVEHVFAFDSNSQEDYPLARFRSVLCSGHGRCVEAWNAAARSSIGEILVQLSDDWTPPRGWDDILRERLDVTKSQVLAVSDGHRTDDLLCMAILTRKRYEEQGFLFHPEFRGVFSDNYFTDQAYNDAVVISGKDAIFHHDHPLFNEGVPVDRTYAEQNSREEYDYGERVMAMLAAPPKKPERVFLLCHEKANPTIAEFLHGWASLGVPVTLCYPVGDSPVPGVEAVFHGTSSHGAEALIDRFLHAAELASRRTVAMVAEYDTQVFQFRQWPHVLTRALNCPIVRYEGGFAAYSPFIADAAGWQATIAAVRAYTPTDEDKGLLDRIVGRSLEFGRTLRHLPNAWPFPFDPAHKAAARASGCAFVHGFKEKL